MKKQKKCGKKSFQHLNPKAAKLVRSQSRNLIAEIECFREKEKKERQKSATDKILYLNANIQEKKTHIPFSLLNSSN